jgi:hypothetical protein
MRWSGIAAVASSFNSLSFFLTLPTPPAPRGELILDNHAVHTAKETRSLARHSAAWPIGVHLKARLLTQSQEGLLPKFARSVLRHIRVTSKAGFTLGTALPSLISATPKPFTFFSTSL